MRWKGRETEEFEVGRGEDNVTEFGFKEREGRYNTAGLSRYGGK